MIKVYIAGPYTIGDTAINVRNAFKVANELLDLGFAPFVPHSTHFWHMMFPREYEDWLKLDNQFVPICDALLRLEGESNGADKEVILAKSKGIHVFYSKGDLIDYYAK